MKHNAFVMIITLVVLGLVTALVLNVWLITGFERDIAHERNVWQKNFILTQRALEQGIAHVVQQRITRPVVFDMTHKGADHTLNVSVERCAQGKQRGLLLTATMKKASVQLCTLRCLVMQSVATTPQGQKAVYAIRGFTIA